MSSCLFFICENRKYIKNGFDRMTYYCLEINLKRGRKRGEMGLKSVFFISCVTKGGNCRMTVDFIVLLDGIGRAICLLVIPSLVALAFLGSWKNLQKFFVNFEHLQKGKRRRQRKGERRDCCMAYHQSLVRSCDY